MALNIVLIFTKVPIPGLAKTRLTKNSVLSEEDVALIAEAMLKDTISLSSKSKADQIYLGYFPEKDKALLENIVGNLHTDANLDKPIYYILQRGSNFDERFGSVVNSAFLKEVNNLIILGADLPHLDPEILNKSFNYLSARINKKKVVIGPANEGGIYLVGINREFDDKWFTQYQLFRGGVEISQFVYLCKDKDIELILLPSYGDIDLEEDLVSLIAYIEALSISKQYNGFYYPNYTAKIIEDLGLYILEIEEETRHRKIGKK